MSPPDTNSVPDLVTLVECKQMQSDFAKYLKNFEVQTDELRRQNKVLYDRYEKEAFRTDELRNSITQAKKKIENIENELSSKLEYMQTTEKRLYDELETPVLS